MRVIARAGGSAGVVVVDSVEDEDEVIVEVRATTGETAAVVLTRRVACELGGGVLIAAMGNGLVVREFGVGDLWALANCTRLYLDEYSDEDGKRALAKLPREFFPGTGRPKPT